MAAAAAPAPGVSIKSQLDALIGGESLSEAQAHEACSNIADGLVASEQVAALLALLARKGAASTEIAGFARAMRERATHIAIADDAVVAGEVPCSGPIVDIVGTGGDGHDTLNISTTAAILAAASGCRVAKHGSVSSSSLSGSADVLQRLGVAMLAPEGISPSIAAAGIAFMFAPNFHPAMRHVAPVRRALGVRTIFNVLGPLLNPANARRLVLGVWSPKLLQPYADALLSLGSVEHALVVHCCGLDELAPIGVADAIEIADGKAVQTSIDTVAIAGPACGIADLKGGGPQHNADAITELLEGGEAAANSAVGRTVALNAAAALYVCGKSASIHDGFKVAQAALASGKGAVVLRRWATHCRTATA
ncbi:hypothetical protein FNF29_06461 [Cafeteria roenbergensis]|uniref:anthranilate phosphoribosyltransferase n=1 Tax=Cafeteria roenbergensis TaxID=33653 RepID=A0A5A8C6X7_CAFRO|nr:hypothetical protein FNF29_06461 [Cafeteria roenbergensis]CAE7244846.1 PAT1 [Symbiodinium sp. KB8]|eukprot:KAA0148836.1 hypothetical protein FNF29_06461 [Cafeteria roenbergensis]